MLGGGGGFAGIAFALRIGFVGTGFALGSRFALRVESKGFRFDRLAFGLGVGCWFFHRSRFGSRLLHRGSLVVAWHHRCSRPLHRRVVGLWDNLWLIG